MRHRGRRLAVAAGLAALVPTLLLTQGSGATAGEAHETHSPRNSNATPYLGWSSWSLQATQYPGTNTQGSYSWLNEENLLEQVDAMAGTLKEYGYEYINIDAGWWMDYDWNPGYDQWGRAETNSERFPSGMEYIADYIESKGLKMGIYLPVGLEKGAYNDGKTKIWGAPGCTTADIVYDDLRTTNGWDSAYAMDFSDRCSQKYIDSLAAMFDDWGVDLLKLDGVGPGGFRGPDAGDNYNNVADVRAWRRALDGTGESIHLQISWDVSHDYVEDWQRYADSWRVGFDIECYCETLTNWQSSSRSIDSVTEWTTDAGPRTGWNNLDSLDVAVGEMDGLTQDERRTLFTFWAVSAAPLYLGDDLTKIDDYGLSLITNREVLAINQLGRAAQPVDTSTGQQVWYIEKKNGSVVVALFNFSDQEAQVTADWDDLGIEGSARVRDVWEDSGLGVEDDGHTVTLPAHGTQLLTVTPARS